MQALQFPYPTIFSFAKHGGEVANCDHVHAHIAQGLINKEIADRLNIGITTVITHRKNIMDKLGMKSVSALTIYAVMHGYVDISKI